jgi:hypothetical protein
MGKKGGKKMKNRLPAALDPEINNSPKRALLAYMLSEERMKYAAERRARRPQMPILAVLGGAGALVAFHVDWGGLLATIFWL